MKVIILFGPPAVGKLTVGKQLSKLTGFPLLHNQLTNDLLSPFFPFGSPEFIRLTRVFRLEMLRSAHRAKLPGLIMTYVWSIRNTKDTKRVQERVRLVKKLGGTSCFIELYCQETTLYKRVQHQSRRAYGKVKTTHMLRELLKKHAMNTQRALPIRAPYLRINTDNTKPKQAAQQIIRRFHLPKT